MYQFFSMDVQQRVRVSSKESLQYRNQLASFEKLTAEDKATFTSSLDQVYYLVSTAFLQAWRDFCLSTQQQRTALPVLNQDLIDDKSTLRAGLMEGVDFQIVSARVYHLFDEYRKVDLKRMAIIISEEKRVPVYLHSYPYCLVRNQTLELIDHGKYTLTHMLKKQAYCSQLATIADLLQGLKPQITLYEEARAWMVVEGREELFRHLKAASAKADYSFRIKGFGKKLAANTPLTALELGEEGLLLVQVKDLAKKWFLQEAKEKKCDGCFDFQELTVKCPCQKVFYCNEKCRVQDKRFHMRMCDYAQMEDLKKPISMAMSPYSKKGVVGLRNLGNTCFMNSCLQCLSHTLPLTNYFLRGDFQGEINHSNPLGSKGRLARSYAQFIRMMWCGQDNSVSPDALKDSVSRIAPMFAGYAQHDSQQFFSFLVDGLHEDLNRIQSKPYVEAVECKDEKKAALLSWLTHIKRNQSIVVDTMTGQYRSQVNCPDCPRKSITYDPFITVTLPLALRNASTLQTLTFQPELEGQPKKLSLPYKRANAEEWQRIVSEELGVAQSRIRLYVVTLHQCIYAVGRDPFKEIIRKMEEEKKKLYTFVLSEQEVNSQKLIELPSLFCKKGYYADQYDNLWVKFPIFLDLASATGASVTDKILRMLYHEVYKNSKKRNTFFGGDSLQSYLQKMKEERPFTLVLKYKRKVSIYYHRLETTFQGKLIIEDSDSLLSIFERIGEVPATCQLNIVFKGLTSFTFERLNEKEDYGRAKYKYNETPVNLEDCFATLKEEEQLEEGNEWYCPDCKQHKRAFKTMTIHRAPSILILHLKRFKQKGFYNKEKNQTKVNFPHRLNMNAFVEDPCSVASYWEQAEKAGVLLPSKERPPTSQNPIYQLYAVSNHFGSMSGGHYTAYAKNDTKWYEFNDSSVHEVNESSVCTSGAYILFYKRI